MRGRMLAGRCQVAGTRTAAPRLTLDTCPDVYHDRHRCACAHCRTQLRFTVQASTTGVAVQTTCVNCKATLRISIRACTPPSNVHASHLPTPSSPDQVDAARVEEIRQQIIEEERKRMLAAHAKNLGLEHLPKGVLSTDEDMKLFGQS